MAKKNNISYRVSAKNGEIFNILKKFRLALKSLRFYPPNHSITKNSIIELTRSLTYFLADYENISFTVKNGGLLLSGENIPNMDFKELSNHLRSLKIRQISILSGITDNELLGFLTILCMSRLEIINRGGLNSLLYQNNITHIKTVELVLDIIDVQDNPIKPAAAGLTAGNAAGPVEILNKKTNISPDETRIVLVRLEGDSHGFAELLLKIINNKNKQNDASTPLYIALKNLELIIGRELPDEKSRLYQNLWETLMLLPENIADKVFSLVINAKDDLFEISDELLSKLSVGKLTDIIIKAVKDYAYDSSTFNNLMEKLPVDHSNIIKIFNSLKGKIPTTLFANAKLSQLDDRKNVFYHKIKKDVTSAQIDQIKTFCGKNSHQSQLFEQLSACRQRDPDEAMVIVLLDRLINANELEVFKKVLKTLNSKIMELVQANNYRLAAKIIEKLGNTEADITEITYKLEIKKMINDICGRKLLSLFIDACVKDDSILKNQEFILFLRQIDPPSTDRLLDMLAVERSAKKRIAGCGLISSINTGNIDFLGQKINDQRWYLTRNIVNILGTIKNKKALEYIERAIIHPDKRVRLETISALVNIGGNESADLLLKLLNDKDEQVALSAIKGLGLIGDREKLTALIPLLQNRDYLYRHTLKNLEIIKALGANKISAGAKSIKSFKHKHSWLFKLRAKQLRRAATVAMDNINNEAPR